MEYKLTYQKFYDALKKDKLLGLKCNDCGAYIVPPKMACPECGSTNLEIYEFEGEGEIKTYTVVRVAPEGFNPPYVVCEVELKEGPWLMGNLIDVDPDSLSMDIVGKKVRITHIDVPGDKYSAGEGVAQAFKLLEEGL